MFIAQQLRRENIIEYILYMWQIEDLIRAHNFNLQQIETNVINQFQVSEQDKKALRDWYDNLIQLMLNEKVEEKGHIIALKNLVNELTELHLALLRSPYHPDYSAAYEQAVPYISEYLGKTKDKNKSIIEIALEFLYGVWILKLKKQKLSQQTQQALNAISNFMSLLAKKYNQYETDEDFYL